LAEVGRDVSVTLDLEAVLERIVRHAYDLLEARDAVIYLLQPDAETLQVSVAIGEYAAAYKAARLCRVGQGIIGAIAQTGVAEVIDEPEHDPRSIHVIGTPEVEADPETMMCVPLLAGDRTIGVIALYSLRDQGLFTED